ncbi:MAG TPA: hypothetical protein VIG41_08600 [Micrococcaceae bacterium]|nr:hypothetical protein [Micrococcaceae bacterium]
MYSLGTDSSNSPRRPGRWAAVGPIVLAVVFLVALVFAANGNDVLGWIIAVIAFGWLALATIVYIGVHKAARFGADQVRQAQAHLARAGGSVAAGKGDPGGTRLVDGGSDGIRDLKIDHSFKIIQVQAGVIEEALGLMAPEDRETVDRALETIRITAHNGRGMLRPDGAPGPSQPGTPGPDDDGPVTGVVVG